MWIARSAIRCLSRRSPLCERHAVRCTSNSALESGEGLDTEEQYFLDSYEGTAEEEETLQRLMLRNLSAGRSQHACDIFDYAKKRADVEMSHHTYNLALRALSVSNQVPESFDIVRELLSVGYKMDIDGYNQMISLCMRNMHIEKAEDIYQDLMDSDVTPDEYTFRFLILGYCRYSQYNRAIDLLRDMNQLRIKPAEDFWISLQTHPQLIQRLGASEKQVLALQTKVKE